MIIREANINDLEQVLIIYQDARDKFAIDKTYQWKDGYPNKDTFNEDLKINKVFVIEDSNKILGVMTILLDEELDYRIIDGKWKNDDPYITIHRIAIKKEYLGQGFATKLITFAKEFAIKNNIFNIRIDTHNQNKDMKKMLQRNGFEYCGIIYLRNKNMDKRDAFIVNLKLL